MQGNDKGTAWERHDMCDLALSKFPFQHFDSVTPISFTESNHKICVLKPQASFQKYELPNENIPSTLQRL
jgi:hypothetical protein